jgi:hypothetical protein
LIKNIFHFIFYINNKMETIKLDDLKNEYLQNITEKELKAYHIAKDHLGESFQLEKSLGFLQWVKNIKNVNFKSM